MPRYFVRFPIIVTAGGKAWGYVEAPTPEAARLHVVNGGEIEDSDWEAGDGDYEPDDKLMASDPLYWIECYDGEAAGRGLVGIKPMREKAEELNG